MQDFSGQRRRADAERSCYSKAVPSHRRVLIRESIVRIRQPSLPTELQCQCNGVMSENTASLGRSGHYTLSSLSLSSLKGDTFRNRNRRTVQGGSWVRNRYGSCFESVSNRNNQKKKDQKQHPANIQQRSVARIHKHKQTNTTELNLSPLHLAWCLSLWLSSTLYPPYLPPFRHAFCTLHP